MTLRIACTLALVGPALVAASGCTGSESSGWDWDWDLGIDEVSVQEAHLDGTFEGAVFDDFEVVDLVYATTDTFDLLVVPMGESGSIGLQLEGDARPSILDLRDAASSHFTGGMDCPVVIVRYGQDAGSFDGELTEASVTVAPLGGSSSTVRIGMVFTSGDSLTLRLTLPHDADGSLRLEPL